MQKDLIPLVYTVDDLTRILPLGRAAAYRLAQSIGVRQGRRIMVSRRSLENWLNSRQAVSQE